MDAGGLGAGASSLRGAGIWFWQQGLLSSQQALRSFVDGFGPAGPAVFVVFQAVQVVVPILPGGLGCLAGVVLFGPGWALCTTTRASASAA